MPQFFDLCGHTLCRMLPPFDLLPMSIARYCFHQVYRFRAGVVFHVQPCPGGDAVGLVFGLKMVAR